jgi:hypothetical protein
MDNNTLCDLENTYADWEEAERKFAHENKVFEILDTLDKNKDKDEYKYQQLRLKYSSAYFSSHPAYCGERLFPPTSFDGKQFEASVHWIALFSMVNASVDNKNNVVF